MRRVVNRIVGRKLWNGFFGAFRRKRRSRRRGAGGRLSLSMLLLALGGGGYNLVERQIRENHAFAGVPRVQD